MRNTYLWTLQLVTGALIFIFGGTHLALMHLDSILGFFGVHIGEPSSWSSMIGRAQVSLWLAFYIVFLIVVLYHGLNGLRGVILELTPSPKMERLVTGLIIFFGLIAFILGIYVPADLFIA